MNAPAVTPTTAQLAQAHTAARLSGPLDVALRSPLLARCLALTAEAMAGRVEFRLDPHAYATAQRVMPSSNQAQPSPSIPPAPLRRDLKRASAGDTED